MLAACNRIMDLCLNEDKTVLWLATVKGVFAYSLRDGKMASWHFRENVPEADYFRCITRIGDTLYLGTMSQGVVRFDIGKKTFSHTVSLGCDVISDISSDGKETVYIATDGNGVHFLSHKEQQVMRRFYHDVNDKEGIHSNSIYSLLVDDRGAVWVGHFQAGLDYSLYQNGLFRTYAYPPQFNSTNLSIRSFVNRGKEKVIGSRDGLFYINESIGVVKSFVKPVLTSDLILTTCFYQGEYYIGTYGGGMMVLNPETLSLNYFAQGDTELFQRGHVFCVKPDTKGNLWIGTSQGLYSYNGRTKQIKHFPVLILNCRRVMFMKLTLILPVKDGLLQKQVCAFMILPLKVCVPMYFRRDSFIGIKCVPSTKMLNTISILSVRKGVCLHLL